LKLRYTRPALAALTSILDGIGAESPQGAQRVRARIRSVIELLLAYPLIGVRTEEDGIRCVTTVPYPYVIFYEVRGDEIVVHAVRHGAQRPRRVT
jgi:plasmid stabilization system protein ParE